MKNTLINFYALFYGLEFARHFRRPPDFQKSRFRIQFTVTNPKQLYLHVNRNSGFHPCFISIYDYGTVENLKNRRENFFIDRLFFDFDSNDEDAERIKKDIVSLRSQGLKNGIYKQKKLKIELQELIITERIAESAIGDAKSLARIFEIEFCKEPLLVFSGFKGCHLYTFFEPVNLMNINNTIYYFAERIKQAYNLHTLDLSVNRDPKSRLSRIPYSEHQLTGLNAVPFKINDSYEEIIEKALNPKIDHFAVRDYSTKMNIHLKNIDEIFDYSYQLNKERKKIPDKRVPGNYFNFKNLDHREFFKDILGEPEREYLEKEYVMYHCPFQDHEDKKPSFMVHKRGYLCLGCNKKGNYWDFLKNYNGWTDNEVRTYLNYFKSNSMK